MRSWILMLVVALGASRAAVAAPVGADVVIVIDRAMPPEKLEVVTRALGSVASAFGPEDRLAVIAFARTARVEMPLQAPGPVLADHLGAITYAEGGNAAVGLRAAYDLLEGSKRSRQVVLISERDLDGVRPMLEKLRMAGVAVRPIAYQTTAAFRSVADPDQLRAFVTVASTRVVVRPTVATVVLIDRSRSMKGVDFEAAKEVASRSLATADPRDVISVVLFDSSVEVLFPPKRGTSPKRMGEEIAQIHTHGASNLLGGLQKAFELLRDINTDVKQVVLVSDGAGPTDGIADLVGDMRTAKIVVSAVGFSGADRDVLADIARIGRGRLYMPEDAGSALRYFFLR